MNENDNANDNDDESQPGGKAMVGWHRERDRERRRRRMDQAMSRWPLCWTETSREGGRIITKVCSYVDPEPDSIWIVEHDLDQGLFRLTAPDGKKTVFRDKPVPYLAVEPDPATGVMEPAIAPGSATRPQVLLLCQEERDFGSC